MLFLSLFEKKISVNNTYEHERKILNLKVCYESVNKYVK